MWRANQIVDRLLEDENTEPAPDPLDSDVAHYVNQLGNDIANGKITATTTASRFYHRTKKYISRGQSGRPVEVRRMGRTKTWKREPGRFQIPVKFGMYDSFYITNENAAEWSTVPPS